MRTIVFTHQLSFRTVTYIVKEPCPRSAGWMQEWTNEQNNAQTNRNKAIWAFQHSLKREGIKNSLYGKECIPWIIGMRILQYKSITMPQFSVQTCPKMHTMLNCLCSFFSFFYSQLNWNAGNQTENNMFFTFPTLKCKAFVLFSNIKLFSTPRARKADSLSTIKIYRGHSQDYSIPF